MNSRLINARILGISLVSLGIVLVASGCAEADTEPNGADTPATDGEVVPGNSEVADTEADERDVVVAEQGLYDDGCSGKLAMVAGGFIKDPYFWGASGIFKTACVRHDHCYMGGLATYGKSRASCDSDFHNQMKDKCKSLWGLSFLNPTFLPRCLTVAGDMYAVVSGFGASHYKSSLCQNGEVYTSANHDTLKCSAWEPYAGTPTVAPASCSGTSGQWQGCRGSGCAACTDLLANYPNYFKNHPYCSPNTTCGGQHYTCNTACPAPTSSDR